MANSIDMAVAIRALRRESVPLKASEIAKREGMTPGAARRALQALASEGAVYQNGSGYWVLVGRERGET